MQSPRDGSKKVLAGHILRSQVEVEVGALEKGETAIPRNCWLSESVMLNATGVPPAADILKICVVVV